MTDIQYSDLMRRLGKLEGLVYVLPDGVDEIAYDVIEEIVAILNEIREGES